MENLVNKVYCMSYYLAFRYIPNPNINFFKGLRHENVVLSKDKVEIKDVKELDSFIFNNMQNLNPSTTGVMLSGGLDSAIVASYLPRGAKAFTIKCVGSPEDSKDIIDESKIAKSYADFYGLEHIVVEVSWQDFIDNMPLLFEYDKVPFHSIEILIDKVLRVAKSMGVTTMCLGESFDLVFGGMDGLLAKDWSFEEFVKRYTF